MELKLVLQIIGTFLALFATDYCWGFYLNEAGKGNAVMAGVWAVLLYIFGSIVVVAYTINPWLIIPAAFGAFAGTYASVKKTSKR